jgi:hypothetical protein
MCPCSQLGAPDGEAEQKQLYAMAILGAVTGIANVLWQRQGNVKDFCNYQLLYGEP